MNDEDGVVIVIVVVVVVVLLMLMTMMIMTNSLFFASACVGEPRKGFGRFINSVVVPDLRLLLLYKVSTFSLI